MILSRSRYMRVAATATLGIALAWVAVAHSAAPKSTATPPAGDPPSWIWLETVKDNQTVYFRKDFEIKAGVSSAKLYATCDDDMTVFIDGKPVVEGNSWATPVFKDVTATILEGTKSGVGRHVIAVRGHNGSSAAGLVVRLVLESGWAKPRAIVTDDSWRVANKSSRKWSDLDFDDSKWAKATLKGKLGEGPWASVTEAALSGAVKFREPTATAPKTLKVAKDFKVELLYTVPKDTQGSWVNMTVDPKGRLIVSDQYGKLYRVTPPPIGSETAAIKVEPIDVAIGEAQGLLWAFDSLYVVVNAGGKYQSGLYRVRDTDGDDKLDKVETLRIINGGGEHGPHGVVLSPDGKSLYLVAGNATALMELAGSLVPRIWGEDQVLPYVTDGNGFMSGERAPGGCVYKVDPDGKSWVLVSMGYRNSFDLAFNHLGDLFTYDSDMEWDVNTPWYRPTRVCQVDSGSDLGYRNGSGKWPTYYPDSLPPIQNVGPGSPTGVAFGYGAKFPAKYQEALFICDWSYGKLYALHLTPDQSTYKPELEEFVTGTPLPLTDVVINPSDHAMYFTIGGRKTLSGLYRVTYAGTEPTSAAKPDDRGAEQRALRHKLEAFHGHKDAAAVETAWPNLGHADRFIRYAARVAIEFQDPASWRDRALTEKDPQSALTALLALVRVSASDPVQRKPNEVAPPPELRAQILKALDRLDWDSLPVPQKLDLLRVYELVIIRLGPLDSEAASHLIARLDPHYPARGRELNSELSKLLIALEAPSAAAKSIALLEKAPTQEEQLDYALALRLLKTGWTRPLREAYFSWFLKAASYKGGSSFGGFLRKIKADAVANLDSEEKVALRPILEALPKTQGPIAPTVARPIVKEWTLDDLTALVDKGLTKRDFDNGRSMFAAGNCFACHRYSNEGGSVGPDLTVASGRFSARDLLESVVDPSKVISDQYAAVDIATVDGRVISGRIVNLSGDAIMVNTNMLDPNGQTSIDRKLVEEMKPSKVSMMPKGLLNTLNREEVLDLVAYLLSRGERSNPMFRQTP